jgi:hypothetical protein
MKDQDWFSDGSAREREREEREESWKRERKYGTEKSPLVNRE